MSLELLQDLAVDLSGLRIWCIYGGDKRSTEYGMFSFTRAILGRLLFSGVHLRTKWGN